MEKQIEQIKESAIASIHESKNLIELDSIRVKFLGKKSELASISKNMGKLSAEDRPKLGKIAHDARVEIESELDKKKIELQSLELDQKLKNESIDVTLPGRRNIRGHLHPITLTLDRIKKIFLNMGYSIEEGPEIETDYFNFEALIPRAICRIHFTSRKKFSCELKHRQFKLEQCNLIRTTSQSK